MPGSSSARRKRVDLHRVRDALPPPVREVVHAYERHLALERGLSAHTVRAYVGDVVSLLGFVHGLPVVDAGDTERSGATDRSGGRGVEALDLQALRAWLAALRGGGTSRTTLARRAAAARTFTAWAHRRGHLATDPGARLASPRPNRKLPSVLRQDQAADLLRASESGAAEQDPSRCVITPCWSCSTRLAFGFPSCAAWTSMMLTWTDESSWYSAKEARSARCPSASPPTGPCGSGSDGSAGVGPAGLATLVAAGSTRWPVPTCERSTYRARSVECSSGCSRHRTTWSASLYCDAFARRWCGSSERSGASWSRYARYHPAIHTCDRRTAEGNT